METPTGAPVRYTSPELAELLRRALSDEPSATTPTTVTFCRAPTDTEAGSR